MSLKLENVNHIYMKGTPMESYALKDAAAEFHKGEYVCIIGHTGSGKSTMIQHLNGLLKPDSGKITLDGKDINEKGEESRLSRLRIGMVFQYSEQQLFEETIEKDIAFGPKNIGITDDELTDCIRKAMEKVGLDYETYREKSPFDLSGGQKRRVAIAGVLAMNPDILVLDEPCAGLDPLGRRELLALTQSLRESGTGIIMVTHSMDDAAEMADRIIVMSGGRIVMDDVPSAVFSKKEELQELGLARPETSVLRDMLLEKGIELPEASFTVQAVAEDIAAYIEKNK